MQRTISAVWLIVLLAAGLLVASAPVTAANLAQGGSHDPDAATAASKANNGIYLVRMLEDPVVAYKGGIAGLKATKPGKGQKIDPNSPNVVLYVSYLDSRHTAALDRVGGARKVYDYRYTFNGFAAQLTADQAEKMASVPGVFSVSPDELNYADTSSTPTFLGLDAPGGLWDQLGGFGSAGDGIIIGVVDSGIWPESLSFTDRIGMNGNATKDGKLDYQQIPGWHGKCTP
ncbi:MAG: S8 family serine peptidase, partial [Thermoanaerobaculaceae bacterium]|nr:S8 family serine peptidase [Thermoanaerobaculaceae bacterium]